MPQQEQGFLLVNTMEYIWDARIEKHPLYQEIDLKKLAERLNWEYRFFAEHGGSYICTCKRSLNRVFQWHYFLCFAPTAFTWVPVVTSPCLKLHCLTSAFHSNDQVSEAIRQASIHYNYNQWPYISKGNKIFILELFNAKSFRPTLFAVCCMQVQQFLECLVLHLRMLPSHFVLAWDVLQHSPSPANPQQIRSRYWSSSHCGSKGTHIHAHRLSIRPFPCIPANPDPPHTAPMPEDHL